jgi:hypothetical protein
MSDLDSHHIGEQHGAYRRGLVVGLTMAEVGILIIFILLLLIGFERWLRRDQESIPRERLKALNAAESTLNELHETLQTPSGSTVNEIRALVRVLQNGAATPEGQSALEEAREVFRETRRVQDELQKSPGFEGLAKEVEKQASRIANQEGQLKRYESQLKAAGLGKGERPCWVRPDGTIEYLYDVVLASRGIRMREYHHPHRERERSHLPIPAANPSEVIGPAEFLRRTQALYDSSLAQNCRFFVVVYDSTGATEKEVYKTLLRTVEGHFYKRLANGPGPF